MGRPLIKRGGRYETIDVATGQWREATKDEVGNLEIDYSAADEPTREAINSAIRTAGAADPSSPARLIPPPSDDPRVLAETAPSYASQGFGQAIDRAMVKWFANSPDAAKKMFQARGYEVRDIPPKGILDPGFNFLVRRNKDEDWTVLDPRTGLASSDIVYDIIDLGADFAQGAFTAAAAAAGTALSGGNPVGGALLAAAAGIGSEGMRQGIGAQMGIPQEVDIKRGIQYGVMNALAPGAVDWVTDLAKSATKATVNAAGEVTLEIGARLAGARKAGPYSRKDIFKMRIAAPEKATEKIAGLGPLADDIIDGLRIVGNPSLAPIPQRLAADEILDKVPATATVNMTPLLDDLITLSTFQDKAMADVVARAGRGKAETIKAAATAFKSDTAPGQAAILLDRLENLMLAHDVSMDSVPIKIAEEIKRTVQDGAFMRGAFQGKEMEKPIVEILSKLAHGMRTEIENIADNAVDPATGAPLVASNGLNYSENMAKVFDVMRAVNKLKEITKLGDTDPIDSKQRLETFLFGAFGDRKSSSLEGLRFIERQTGIKIVGPAKKALLSTHFGDEGAAEFLPQGTPGMYVIGAPLLAGAGALGYKAGGAPGAAAAIGGLAATASPRNILRIGKIVNAVSERATQVAAATRSVTPPIPKSATNVMKMGKRIAITQEGRITVQE